MANFSEQRQFRRYPIQLPVLLQRKTPHPRSYKAGWTRNLGCGGACVELAERLPPRIPLRVRLQGDQGALEVEATVAWVGQSRRGDGAVIPHGLAFTRISPEVRQDLLILLVSAGLVRPAGLRLHYEVATTCQPGYKAGRPIQGRTRDISRGGLLLRLPRALPPSTAVQLKLHTPKGPLAAEGAIVWVAPPEGRTPGGPVRHGLRFTSINWTTLLSLAPLLAARP